MSRISVVEIKPKFQLRYCLSVLILFLLALYFTRYTLFGTKGILGLKEKKAHLENLIGQLAQKKKENAILEEDVARLSPKTLDLDFLDERARSVLGFATPQDVIFLEQEKEEAREKYE